MQKWSSEAPSNIALIKYMGKKDPIANIPANPSISYTLNNLKSRVTLELSSAATDSWEPLISHDMPNPITLSTSAQTRFLKHLAMLKSQYNVTESFIVRSNNNFPQSCGIASSASSFAALTKCATQALSYLANTEQPSVTEQAAISRQGSGSSCRSFFKPWAIWDENSVDAINLPYPELYHQVVIISAKAKTISSSAAHKLVENSPTYPERSARAKNNLDKLLTALQSQDWHAAYLICFEEFQDMHNLFNTSGQAFSYLTPATTELLANLQDFWLDAKDGPIITMDAGPNIHLLYRPDQISMANTIKQKYLDGKFHVL